jgi:hypothetical protein
VWVLLAGGATVMAVSGCLWKDTVNQLPRVEISGPTAVHIGETAKFEAKPTDGKSGMMFEWGKAPTCPDDVSSARQAPGERKFGDKITWWINPDSATDKAAYCTFVIATDDRGAVGYAKHPVTLVDRTLLLTVPAQVTNNMLAKYRAQFSDDATAAAEAKFFWGSSAQPDEPCKAAEAGAREDQRSLVTPKTAEWESAASRRPYCVFALARDKFGAEYTAQQIVDNILNGGPPALPRLVTPKEMPVGIFSQVRVAAAAPGELLPSDVLKFTWTVKRPDGTALPAAGCEGAVPLDSEICFEVTDGGEYRIDLMTEEALQTATGGLNLKVEDRPPCIRLTDPTLPETGATTVLSLDGEQKVLKVEQVVDDGDPLPSVGRASQGAFVWTIRTVKPGEEMTTPFALLPHAIFDRYTLPASQYRLGDQVEVRVEYRDRLGIRDPKALDLSHCKPTDLSCETRPGSKCVLRVGWKVMYL